MSTDRSEIETQIRNFIVRNNPSVSADAVKGSTAIVQNRLLTSLQITEMILLIESLMDHPLDPAALNPKSFQNIDSIIETFFPEAG